MNTQQPESLQLAHVCDHPIPPDWIDIVAAVKELLRLHAENEALQQVYDARQLEIDRLRGVTKSKLLAQPVAWMVYLPSIDTQHLYYSQEDMGYVDDVTNHADAEVTPLYEMAAPKAEVAPAGEYPPLPDPKFTRVVDGIPCITLLEHGLLMRACVDADRAMRAQAAPQPAVQQGAGTRQEPVAWQSRTRPTWGSNTTPWSPWESCTKEQAEDYWKTPLLHGWAYEARALYIAPQPAPVAQVDAEDAARYRWLAAHCRSTSEHWGGRWSIVVEGPAPKSHDSEDDFDAAIDAARSAKEGA